MISKFRLKFGRTPSTGRSSFAATPVTVFVGPNNSGKSRILAEIEQYCRSGTENSNNYILVDIAFDGISSDSIEEQIEQLARAPNPGETIHVGHIIIGSRHGRIQVDRAMLKSVMEDPCISVTTFCQHFLTHTVLMLDGQNRIRLVNTQGAGDLQQSAANSLQVLFRDDRKRREVRRIVHEAFGSHFVIDPTNLGQLRIRLSRRNPSSELEERGIHAEAVKFHADAEPIETASDGVKAFSGIITEVVAGDPRVLLIDEPEAFLHPSLAHKLGYEVSRAALSSGKTVFVSTHSSSFVMGCIHSGAPVSVVRLTYRDRVATARCLPGAEIVELMRNPLLRSTGVLSALFYEFVVVTESDADRAFYQEVNERMLRFEPESGIPNCLFINAQNKQTVQTILRPLRQLGIPAVGVVDIDVLKDGGTTWTKLLSAADVPAIAHGALATMRAAVKMAMEASGKDMKREGGIAVLAGSEREAAQNLLSQLAEYGIFVVPGGELESWLRSLGATGHSPGWLISIFEKMGVDPEALGYVKPSRDDVWALIREIRGWLVDPNRKGIPA